MEHGSACLATLMGNGVAAVVARGSGVATSAGAEHGRGGARRAAAAAATGSARLHRAVQGVGLRGGLSGGVAVADAWAAGAASRPFAAAVVKMATRTRSPIPHGEFPY
jgi:hypothetical protein